MNSCKNSICRISVIYPDLNPSRPSNFGKVEMTPPSHTENLKLYFRPSLPKITSRPDVSTKANKNIQNC